MKCYVILVLVLIGSFFYDFSVAFYIKSHRCSLNFNSKQYLNRNSLLIRNSKTEHSYGKSKSQSAITSKVVLQLIGKCLFFITLSFRRVVASVGTASASVESNMSPIQGVSVWGALFFLSAALHSAESAITKLSPWKVQQFIDEEGPTSPFATLLNNMTSLLSTILVITTACSIYSTGLFFATAAQVFPNANLGLLTAVLTIVTLFLGELLPKALAVSNSELVARKVKYVVVIEYYFFNSYLFIWYYIQMVPIISRLSLLLLPLTSTMTSLSNFILKIAGMRQKEETNVTENMLRLVVSEAERSEGIKTDEGRM